MEEINIKEFIDYYKKYIPIIIILTLISVIGTAVYNMSIKKPLYTTKTSIVLVKNEESTSNTTGITGEIDVMISI